MDLNKNSVKWEDVSLSVILSGRFEDGSKYLEHFLSSYAKIFNKQNLNASCNNCIGAYHKEYKDKMSVNSNASGYVLKKKYIGIWLTENPSYKINNSNITPEIGAKLLKQKGEYLFEKFPAPVKESVSPSEKTTKKPKRKSTKN